MAKPDRKVPDRAHFMTAEARAKMGDGPRTHQNCRDKTGKSRPGKSRQDNFRKYGDRD